MKDFRDSRLVSKMLLAGAVALIAKSGLVYCISDEELLIQALKSSHSSLKSADLYYRVETESAISSQTEGNRTEFYRWVYEVAEEKKFRFERNLQRENFPAAPFPPPIVYAWDGQNLRSFGPNEQTGIMDNDFSEYDVFTYPTPLYFNYETDRQPWYVFLESLFSGEGESYVLTSDSVFEGEEVWRLDVGDSGKYWFLFDPSQDLNIFRFQAGLREVHILETELVNGFWMPIKAEEIIYRVDSSAEDEPVFEEDFRRRFDMLEVDSTNKDIPENEFTIEYPRGVEIYNAVLGQALTIGEPLSIDSEILEVEATPEVVTESDLLETIDQTIPDKKQEGQLPEQHSLSNGTSKQGAIFFFVIVVGVICLAVFLRRGLDRKP